MPDSFETTKLLARVIDMLPNLRILALPIAEVRAEFVKVHGFVATSADLGLLDEEGAAALELFCSLYPTTRGTGLAFRSALLEAVGMVALELAHRVLRAAASSPGPATDVCPALLVDHARL